jgi:hypothetical protein
MRHPAMLPHDLSLLMIESGIKQNYRGFLTQGHVSSNYIIMLWAICCLFPGNPCLMRQNRSRPVKNASRAPIPAAADPVRKTPYPFHKQICPESSLTLFMLWILTNDADFPFALDDFAFLAHRFYRRSYLHDESSFPHCKIFMQFAGFSRVFSAILRVTKKTALKHARHII